MNKIRAVLGVFIAAMLALVIAPTPAQAGVVCETLHFCGDFKHHSPDNGYDGPIKITCDWGDKFPIQWIAEGESATCHDTDGFYVPTGKNVTCTRNGWEGAWVTYDSTGWKKITDRENYRCVIGVD